MSHDEEANENSRLLDPRIAELRGGKQRTPIHDEASSIVSSHVPKEEQELAGAAIGERLPYNDYTTIDRLHDLVSARRSIDGFKCDQQGARSKIPIGIELLSPGKS
ncbi:uncharacterized protein RSE6_08822 [Rhynchosporium secalis]|uniref:Uncharacterized protein n=1 Tax=Rhynchosporium secalis TaxID=38038 RepID=A0A1E1MGF2_RHYSE|nr:uncharacterized protein RSE6_08822 [Rhynchosporium secalis]